MLLAALTVQETEAIRSEEGTATRSLERVMQAAKAERLLLTWPRQSKTPSILVNLCQERGQAGLTCTALKSGF